ncbi:hypothetical protein LguiB_036145 [Lonicera macranthoides]
MSRPIIIFIILCSHNCPPARELGGQSEFMCLDHLLSYLCSLRSNSPSVVSKLS